MEFEKNITTIIHVITEFVQPAQIILFGSRTCGTAQHYSDYDIVLAGVDMDHRTERHLKQALDDRLGTFTVDFINIDKVDPEFQDIIMRNGMMVYEN